MRLDFELKTYGPDTSPVRTLLREQVLHTRVRFWSGVTHQGQRSAFNEVLADADAMFAALDRLRPTSGEQKEHLATARENYTTFLHSQITMIRTLAYRVPNFLLIVVLGWSCLLFFGYGLLAGINVLTGVVAALGAAAVASAILVILELRDPFRACSGCQTGSSKCSLRHSRLVPRRDAQDRGPAPSDQHVAWRVPQDRFWHLATNQLGQRGSGSGSLPDVCPQDGHVSP